MPCWARIGSRRVVLFYAIEAVPSWAEGLCIIKVVSCSLPYFSVHYTGLNFGRVGINPEQKFSDL